MAVFVSVEMFEVVWKEWTSNYEQYAENSRCNASGLHPEALFWCKECIQSFPIRLFVREPRFKQ